MSLVNIMDLIEAIPEDKFNVKYPDDMLWNIFIKNSKSIYEIPENKEEKLLDMYSSSGTPLLQICVDKIEEEQVEERFWDRKKVERRRGSVTSKVDEASESDDDEDKLPRKRSIMMRDNKSLSMLRLLNLLIELNLNPQIQNVGTGRTMLNSSISQGKCKVGNILL